MGMSLMTVLSLCGPGSSQTATLSIVLKPSKVQSFSLFAQGHFSM